MKKIYFMNGAARKGFGETTTQMIINQGDKVVGIYSKDDEANAIRLQSIFTKDQLELSCIDILDNSKLLSYLTTFEYSIDGFVNADFLFELENIENYDYKLSEKLFQANFHAPKMMAIELKKRMHQGSSIVFVTSTEAFRGSYGGISYASSKAATHNLVQSLACIWGKIDRIRVNAIAAGWIGGEMDTDDVFNLSRNITPLGRLGTPEEVANTVCLLLSEKTSFINGQSICLDGGYLCVDQIAKYEFEQQKK